MLSRFLVLFIFIYLLSPLKSQDIQFTRKADDPKSKISPLKNPLNEIKHGSLRFLIKGEVHECPLLRTDVQVKIIGSLASVNLVQTFENPFDETIEVIYVFPISHRSSIDKMDMRIGRRFIKGLIKSKEEAQVIYKRALSSGKTTSLLTQNKPNIFTQAIGNIQKAVHEIPVKMRHFLRPRRDPFLFVQTQQLFKRSLIAKSHRSWETHGRAMVVRIRISTIYTSFERSIIHQPFPRRGFP